MKQLALSILPQQLAVCRLGPDEAIPDWLSCYRFWSVTRTEKELSVVLPQESVPDDWQAEKGWRCLEVLGPLDFNLVGVLASLSEPLARAGISIFALSTYDTDYILVRETDLDEARDRLAKSGHVFR